MSDGPTGEIQLRVFDGTREPINRGVELLIRLRDGNQKEVVSRFYRASEVPVFEVAVFNNFGDDYAVVVSADQYIQAGFFPVKVSLSQRQVIDIMLLPKRSRFNFERARWEVLAGSHAELIRLLSHGAGSPQAARDRYEALVEQRPASLACFFNLTTAMSGIHLPQGTPLDYLKELAWDDSFAQDRFFAFARAEIVDQVRRAAVQHVFSPEHGSAIFHPGATTSFKEIRLGEANVQLTFHENDTREIDGEACVLVEPDIDYYKDLGAHTLLEVIPNSVRGSLSDPKTVYMLRWIAGRHGGLPEFTPPYTIETVRA